MRYLFPAMLNTALPSFRMLTLRTARLTSAGLAYRTFALRAPQRLTWQQVYRQFGLHPDKASDKNTVQMFRRNILRELKKIKLAWPGLSYAIAPGLLILHPSRPAIPPSPVPPRLVE